MLKKASLAGFFFVRSRCMDVEPGVCKSGPGDAICGFSPPAGDFFVISTVHQLCDGKRRRGQCFRAGRRAGYGASGSVALNRWDELVATRCLWGRRWGWLRPVGGVCQASRAEIVGPVRPDADREKTRRACAGRALGVVRRLRQATIMPAPTVLLVDSSMRMKAPVARESS